jgi:proteasome lid subunit RPN8/RPN11
MSTWQVEGKSTCADKCSWAEAQERTILFSDEVWEVVKGLCEKVEDEWQMLLIGKIDKDVVNITDYMIPKQRVTAASVINDDAITKEMIDKLGIVATIHSHSSMGVFFSSTDIKDTNMSLIDYHVVVNNKHEVVGAYKTKLPCGMLGMGKLAVKRLTNDAPLVIKGIENISKAVSAVAGWERYNQQYNDRPSYPAISDKIRKKWDNWRKPWSKDDEKHIGQTLLEQGGV